MKASFVSYGAALLTSAAVLTLAQTGPYSPEDWPPTVDINKTVHFIVTDGTLFSPGGFWEEGLQILTGGDQGTADFTIGGHQAKKVTGSFLNVADPNFYAWADSPFIDILVQVYGDEAVLNDQGQPRNFNFLTGVIPELDAPNGGQIAVEAKNKRWNWVLFRIPNGIRASDGTRRVGSIPANAQGGFQNGGVNGGTIRIEGVPGLIVRVIAFGEEGAFGNPEDINKFFPPEGCDPEPETNLAGIDIHAGTADHMVVLAGHDHDTTTVENVGPASDRRRAVVPNGMYLNFGITDNYLGKPCNDPRTIKVCVDYFDDPAFAGLDVSFGPEAYATDDVGGIGFVAAEKRPVLQGTGQWLRRSWTVPAVNLKGVNADSYTAGPRFVSINGQVAVSRLQLAVLRTGDHPLAGQDPLASCVEDPNICTDAYGRYAELDLGRDVRDGLDVGSSGGDQNMIVEEAGPAGDRRLAVRAAHDDGAPGFQHQYLNFAILEEALGPNSQPNAHLAICITYYDDPNLIGTTIRPEVYQTERNGVQTLGFTPGSWAVALEGTDQWRTAYWEITDMKFNGVNQGPQAAARFTTTDAGDIQGKIAVTRVRYAVIRPCGPNAGENLLEECKPILDVSLAIERAGNDIRLSWPAAGNFQVESTADLSNPQWGVINVVIEVIEGRNVVTLPIGAGTQYFRLMQ